MTRDQKYEKFRALHERPGIFVIPNPWNAGSARILTTMGFEALATTSAGFAFSIGRADVSADLTRDAVLANAKEIVDATELPVSADMQDGFGQGPEACAETVRLAAGVGLAGGSIEDATGNDEDPIYDFALSVERVADGRADLADTIRRLRAFAEAGADVLYAPGLPSLEAIREVCAAVSPKPVNVLMGLRGATYSVEELAATGAKRISVGGSLARVALGAFTRAAREIKDKGTFTFATDAAPHAELNAIMVKGKRDPEGPTL